MNIEAIFRAPVATPASEDVRKWLAELEKAARREKDWRESAKTASDIYDCDEEEYPFNILYSNTETIAPTLYNNTPRPDVRARYRTDDVVGKAGAQVTQRTLDFLLDNTLGDYTPFDDLMEKAVLQALVAGRGAVRWRYEAALVPAVKTDASPPEDEEADDGEERSSGEAASEPEPGEEEVAYEYVGGEEVSWDHLLFGYATTWAKVPWLAYLHFMDRAELEKNFGEAGRKVPLTITPTQAETFSEEVNTASEDGRQKASLAMVAEIWDKASRRVLFLCPGAPEKFLRDVPDPLKLTTFFPSPKPLNFSARVKGLVPQTLYKSYESQAEELNTITRRIRALTKVLKVRGAFDSSVEGLDKILEAGDNEMKPVEGLAAFQDAGNAWERLLWIVPISEVITALQQLHMNREAVKAVIYEITGIGDILRGAGAASETATAQGLKDQWGRLRLKCWQKAVQHFVRDNLRIVGEIALTKFSIDTLQNMTGMRLPTQADKRVAEQVLAQAQQTGTVSPDTEKAKQLVAAPSWEEVKEVLENDLLRNYRIDIETNSTIAAEASEDKQNISEFMNATAQFMNGVGPMVQEGILPFEAAKAMLLAATKTYRFGVDVEDQIKLMQAPQAKTGPDPKQVEAEATLRRIEAEGKLEQARHTQSMEKIQRDVEALRAKVALDAERMSNEVKFLKASHELRMQELWERSKGKGRVG